MSKKWYNVFVSTDAPSGESEPPDDAAQSSDAAQCIAGGGGDQLGGHLIVGLAVGVRESLIHW